MKIKYRSKLASVVVNMPGLMSIPKSENDLCHQEGTQNLATQGHLEGLQESEIENFTILQSVDSSKVKGVLPRKREVRPVGI